MVDLKAKPYCLPDEDVRWVEETIAGMTPEEKVGQLFFQLTASQDENYLRELMEKYHLGGCRYNPMPGAAVQQQNRTLQKYAKVPVFIACNTEAGGDGACADGTNIGSGIKIGATRNNDYAYALGKMANEEAAAIAGVRHPLQLGEYRDRDPRFRQRPRPRGADEQGVYGRPAHHSGLCLYGEAFPGQRPGFPRRASVQQCQHLQRGRVGQDLRDGV